MTRPILQSQKSKGGRNIVFNCAGCNDFVVVATRHLSTRVWTVRCDKSKFEHRNIVDGLEAPCQGTCKPNMVSIKITTLLCELIMHRN